jgi:hypothetical protein
MIETGEGNENRHDLVVMHVDAMRARVMCDTKASNHKHQQSA